MKHFVAYHSVKQTGSSLKDAMEGFEELVFWSRKLPIIKQAIGNIVWLIEGVQSKKDTLFLLHGAYTAKDVNSGVASVGENGKPQFWLDAKDVESDVLGFNGSEGHVISGDKILAFNALPLNDLAWFISLKKSQANFSLGFNRINDSLALEELEKLLSKTNTRPIKEFVDVDFLDVGQSASEGNAKLITHISRERNAAIIKVKKGAVLKATKKLCCEVCDFDFKAVYGDLGDGFCEVHHLKPLAESKGAVETKLEDLAIICSNCHRIIHRQNPMLTIEGLAKQIQKIRAL